MFRLQLKKYGELGREKQLVVGVGYNVLTLCRNLHKKKIFNVQGVWHSPYMLPTMVRGHAFRFITRQPPSRGHIPLSAIWEPELSSVTLVE